MTQEFEIEKKASDIVHPTNEVEALQAIKAREDLSGASLQGMALNNLNSVGAILRKTDLTKADLSHGLFINPNFYKASLLSAAVNNTVFIGGDMLKTSFKEADLSEAVLIGVDGEEANFEDANLRNAALVSANLEGANFTRANLKNARLASLNVKDADFTDADLTGARAYQVDWTKPKVPPAFLPESLVILPNWALAVLVGGFLGALSLLIYGMLRRRRKNT